MIDEALRYRIKKAEERAEKEAAKVSDLIAKAGLKILPAEDGDTCPECGGPARQRIVRKDGSVHPVMCDECGTKARAAVDERERIARTPPTDAVLERSGVDMEVWMRARLEHVGEGPPVKAVRRMLAAMGRGEGYGLFLHGATGVGKTHLAISAMREAVEGSPPDSRWAFARFTRCVWLESSLFRSESREAEVRKLCRVPFLVIDELQPGAPWFMACLAALLEERTHRWTIITSNLSLPELARIEVIDRVADRIAGICEPVEYEGASRRSGPKAVRTKTVGEILGKGAA